MGIKDSFRYWCTRLVGWISADNKNKDGKNLKKKQSSKVVSIVKAPGVPDQVVVKQGGKVAPGPMATAAKRKAKPKTKDELEKEALDAESKRKAQEEAEAKPTVNKGINEVKTAALPILEPKRTAAPARFQMVAARQPRIMRKPMRITPKRPVIGR